MTLVSVEDFLGKKKCNYEMHEIMDRRKEYVRGVRVFSLKALNYNVLVNEDILDCEIDLGKDPNVQLDNLVDKYMICIVPKR